MAKVHIQNPFRLFVNADIMILLVINALVNGVMYGMITTISSTFEEAYPYLTETTIGISFLAYGGSMVIGSILNGIILNKEYQKFKAEYGDPAGDAPKDGSIGRVVQDVFPLETVGFPN